NAIIATLQDAPESEMRRNEVYHVRNSSAVDVANALTTYFGNILTILNEGNQQTATISLEREVIIVAEPITNKLLINATPRYFEEVMRMIIELDAEQPMVVIQVLVAEVDLTSDEEFGVEFGLQSPVLFQRGLTGTNIVSNTVSQFGFNFL